MIKELKIVEGGPIDSEALTSTLHSNGVNIRYLGKLLQKVEEEHPGDDFNHVKFLIEKEIVSRSAKHVFNSFIRKSPEKYVS